MTDGPAVGNICPQGYPQWTLVETAEQLGGSADDLRTQLESDPRNSEDCLFLDVVVPRGLFGGQKSRCGKNGGKNCFNIEEGGGVLYNADLGSSCDGLDIWRWLYIW